MESLDCEKLLTTKALSDKLELHQSSVSHTLKELIEEDLVIKKGKGYRLSNLGIIQKNLTKWMGKTLRCVEDEKDFFLSHDLSSIPIGFLVSIGLLCEGLEDIKNDPVKPFHIEEIIMPLLTQAKHIMIASSFIIPEHHLHVAAAICNGARCQTVTSQRIIQELQGKNLTIMDNLHLSQIEVRVHNNINMHLIVTESHLILSLPRLDGCIDLQNIIISKDSEALKWSRMLFYYFFYGSSKVESSHLLSSGHLNSVE
jgi:predicted transcriptional regulator